jgi:hypothetical protein
MTGTVHKISCTTNIPIDDKWAYTYNNRATAYQRLGQVERAILSRFAWTPGMQMPIWEVVARIMNLITMKLRFLTTVSMNASPGS